MYALCGFVVCAAVLRGGFESEAQSSLSLRRHRLHRAAVGSIAAHTGYRGQSVKGATRTHAHTYTHMYVCQNVMHCWVVQRGERKAKFEGISAWHSFEYNTPPKGMDESYFAARSTLGISRRVPARARIKHKSTPFLRCETHTI